MLNAEGAIANSSQTGKAANRLDEVKGRVLRRTQEFGEIRRIYSGFFLRSGGGWGRRFAVPSHREGLRLFDR
jgi:hypothetical protein